MSNPIVSMKHLVLGSISALSLLGASNALAATELVNLVTDQSGMHRIYYTDLVNKGVDLSGVNHRRFGLSLNGEPVAIRTKGQDEGRRSLFGEGGFIEFYAEGANSLYTNQQAFTLSVLNGREARANRAAGRINTVRGPKASLTASTTREYQHTQVVEENNFYDTIAPSDTDPYHFGQTISLVPNTPVYTFTLDNVAGDGKASIAVEMYGLLDFAIDGNDHDYAALINGVEIGNQQFDGATIDTLTAENVPVNNGNNTVQYQYRPVAGVAFDRIALNKVTVTYPRETQAIDGYLHGYVDAPQLGVSNVSNATVYRKNGNSIERLHRSSIKVQGSGVLINTDNQAGDYLVVSDGGRNNNGYKQVAEVAAIADEQNITEGDAQYLIIAHPSLMGETLNELVQMRQAQYTVKVVDVNQIFAQFGNHLPDGQAIHDYVKYAEQNMNTEMVLIVGNDSYDYKNISTQSKSLVPTKYVTTPAGVVTVTQTPSDAIYGDVNGDQVPDLAVGRIAARTTTELGNVIEKIRDYQAREGYVGRILIAADKDDNGTGISFKADAEDLIAAMPENWGGAIRNDFRAYPDVDGAQNAKDKLNAAVNAGVSVVSYIGHSSQQSWSYATPPLLTAQEISNFNNLDKPTVVTQWGCWNTYFVDPNGNSMADEFMLRNQTGAVAVLGASTLTSSSEERALGIELNQRLYQRGMPIGQAIIEAKQALAQSDEMPAIQLGFNLMGDPALVIAH